MWANLYLMQDAVNVHFTLRENSICGSICKLNLGELTINESVLLVSVGINKKYNK
jgi:hypothetical protein